MYSQIFRLSVGKFLYFRHIEGALSHKEKLKKQTNEKKQTMLYVSYVLESAQD